MIKTFERLQLDDFTSLLDFKKLVETVQPYDVALYLCRPSSKLLLSLFLRDAHYRPHCCNLRSNWLIYILLKVIGNLQVPTLMTFIARGYKQNS